MNSGTFSFNGHSSGDFGIFLTEEPTFITPERKSTVVKVPGRSGDIVVMEDAWENYEQEINIGFGSNDYNVQDDFYDIANWLNSAKGYARLEVDNEPDVFRLACAVNGAEVTNHLNRIGEATLTFNCRPERFLKEFEDKKDANNRVCGNNNPVFDLSSSKMFNNTTKYPARPLIHIEDQPSSFAGGTIRIQSYTGIQYTITLAAGGTQTGGVVIDCETGETFGFYNNNQNFNNKISFGATGIPRLEPRTSTISISSGTFSDKTIHMVPRLYLI